MTTFLSVCDGLGCANLAFSPLGWKQVLSSEIDAAPRSTLAHHLGAADARRTLPSGSIPLWGDFTALRVRHLRRIGVRLPDVLCGGTPCQSFSVAGQRGGMTDPRGELTIAFLKLLDALDAARLADGLPPVVALWENVPGVLNHPDNPFGHVLSGLVGEDTPIRPAGGKWSDAGLAVGPSRAAAWRVLDAQYFGLAQRRERVFVVASAREGFDPATILFEPDGVRRHSPPSREAGEGAAPTVTGGARQRGGYSHDDVPLTSATLTAGYGERAGQDFDKPGALVTAYRIAGDGAVYEEGEVTTPLTRGTDPSANVIAFDTTQITSATNRCNPQQGDPCHPLSAQAHPPAVAFALRGRDGGAMPEVEGEGDTVGTLRAAEGGSSRDYLASTSAVRRLTPRECCALQGVPRDYFDAVLHRGRPLADGPVYKMLGNGWAVPVVAWLGERIAAELATSDQRRAA